ncbi:MAG: thermonuclease family protein [Candidatus Omnitrophica bacterium]|nr:thermonuclease family protein [Candidatus Omnitrophota bacterium]
MAPPKFYDIAPESAKPKAPISAKVKEVYAPNIIQIETGESVRLLGVEASRKIDVNRKAIEFLSAEIKGKTIRLAYDKKMRDDMGRLLAYVTLESTPAPAGTIQEDLLWRGYVYSSKKFPCKQYHRFRFYEKGAKKANRGVWEGTR